MSPTLDEIEKQAAILQQTANELISRIPKMTLFEEAARWKADALALVGLFEQYQDSLAEFRATEEQALQEAKKVHEASSFFKRNFGSRKIEESHEGNIKDMDKGIESVEKSITVILDLVDETPISKDEQKEMLNELRLKKSELSTDKRSVDESMRVIRTQARQRMTGYTGVRGGLTGSIARYERSSIRRQKENALSPHENTKAALERRLIDIDRRINRIFRLTGEDFGEEKDVVRCAYCGRRVTPGLPCPGCGSDKTTQENLIPFNLR
jgi:hypothetical protein